MISNDEMITLHQEQHGLIDQNSFDNPYMYIQHLMHVFAYQHIATLCVGKSVLDIGCNKGYGTELLAANASNVIGVDVSQKAIETARNGCQNTKIEFQTIDGKNLPFENDTFDVVVGCQVIEHIADVSSFMTEVTRVLLPGGLALFTTPNAVIRLTPGMKPWNKFHVQEYTARELRELFASSFRSVDVAGLFASDKIEELLKERYAQAMAITVRESNLSALRKSVRVMKKLLPDAVSNFLYAQLFPASQCEAPDNFKESFSLNDFYYAQDELDAALDILVVAQEKY